MFSYSQPKLFGTTRLSRGHFDIAVSSFFIIRFGKGKRPIIILRKIAARLVDYGDLDFWLKQSLSGLEEWIEILEEAAEKR